MKTPTASELKRAILDADPETHFFDRDTMHFFGDTMRNFGTRKTTIETRAGTVEAFELYRKRTTAMGFKDSHYFNASTFLAEFPIDL